METVLGEIDPTNMFRRDNRNRIVFIQRLDQYSRDGFRPTALDMEIIERMKRMEAVLGNIDATKIFRRDNRN